MTATLFLKIISWVLFSSCAEPEEAAGKQSKIDDTSCAIDDDDDEDDSDDVGGKDDGRTAVAV